MICLIAYQIFGVAVTDNIAFILLSGSMWFLVISWLFAPFLFNPSGFEWQKIVDDWEDWGKWISNHGGIGVPATKSWESWWDEEQEHLQCSGLIGRFCEVLLSMRFLLFQYGIVYQLNVSNSDKSIMVSTSLIFSFNTIYRRCILYANPHFDMITGLWFVLVSHCVCHGRLEGQYSFAS